MQRSVGVIHTVINMCPYVAHSLTKRDDGDFSGVVEQ